MQGHGCYWLKESGNWGVSGPYSSAQWHREPNWAKMDTEPPRVLSRPTGSQLAWILLRSIKQGQAESLAGVYRNVKIAEPLMQKQQRLLGTHHLKSHKCQNAVLPVRMASQTQTSQNLWFQWRTKETRKEMNLNYLNHCEETHRHHVDQRIGGSIAKAVPWLLIAKASPLGTEDQQGSSSKNTQRAMPG